VKTLYSASATTSGGRDGHVESSDGELDLDLAMPEGLGGKGGSGTNPEQLFAAGYSACFESALRLVAGRQKKDVGDASVRANVDIGQTGDGGFGWAMQELATARKYGLKVATVVFSDGRFGNVDLLQNRQFGAAYGTELANPRLDRLAEAFGVAHARAETPDALREVLSRALAAGEGPLLVDVPVGDMPSPWPLMRLTPPPFAAGAAPPPNPLGPPPGA